jgi:hypothetical protein
MPSCGRIYFLPMVDYILYALFFKKAQNVEKKVEKKNIVTY